MPDRSIDRTALASPTPEPNSPDPILESRFRQQLRQRYADPADASGGDDGTEVDGSCGAAVEQATSDQEEREYDFRLFARAATSAVKSIGAQRVTLRSLSPAGGESGLRGRGRPDEYYFTGATGPELAEQYARAAVSSGDVIEGLGMKWRGMELPWRVTVIRSTEADKAVGDEQREQARTKGRKRSGKKRRIVVRRRLEVRAEREVRGRRTREEREAAEREKRTRRNREKKVKRKRKDKVKKVEEGRDQP